MARVFGQGNCLTPEQSAALEEPELSDSSCSGAYLNTCGIDVPKILSQYELYNPQAGLSLTRWGDIDLDWGDVDQSWDSVSVDIEIAYTEGDQVIQFEQDDDYLIIYQAIDDIESPPGPFDPDEWEEVCRVRFEDKSVLIPLLNKYPYWSNDSVRWIVLFDVECGEYTCLYTAVTDPGNNPPPDPNYWRRVFCVENGKKSKCTKTKKCGPGRVLVSLSSGDNDLICVPVESTVGVGPRR